MNEAIKSPSRKQTLNQTPTLFYYSLENNPPGDHNDKFNTVPGQGREKQGNRRKKSQLLRGRSGNNNTGTGLQTRFVN